MKATYTLNTGKSGIEIRFPEKPAPETLAALKAAGYRWSVKGKFWYARQTEKALCVAQQVTGAGAPSCVPSPAALAVPSAPSWAEKQAALCVKYHAALVERWKGDARMISYCEKESAALFAVHGVLVSLDKPRIETSFCFGESGHDMDKAVHGCHVAQTDQDYFIRENMRTLESMIRDLADETAYAWVEPGAANIGKLFTADCLGGYRRPENAFDLTEQERAQALETVQHVRAAFEKRLQTYLKRYGLSKVRTWTYWRDA